MMNINRRLPLNPNKAFDTMTTLAPISRTTTKPSETRGLLFTRGVLACVAILTAMLNVSEMRGQATPTALPVVTADFNHDGIPDVLALSTTSPTATIAFGTVPYGTFTSGAKAVTFPAGCTSLGTGSVLVGDFNGDGFPDLAFFCGGAATGVMLGNGDGTFAPPRLIAGIIASVVVLGDFNHDGKLDIAAIGLNGSDTPFRSIAFLPGNGDGTFGNEIFSTYASTINYVAVASADINGDGYPDIVAENFAADSTPSIDVFGNNQDGTFGVLSQQVTTPTTLVSIPGATASSSILFGNFFGKGATDFAVSTFGASAGLSVFQNNSTATTYAFNDPVTIPVAGLTGAHAGSFLGTALTDVAVSNGTSIAVLANDGAGNLAATYPTLTVASTSPFFAVADSNGDGYADLYTASNTNGALQFAANVTSGSATATSLPFSLGIGTQAVTGVWNGNLNLAASSAFGSQIVVGTPSTTTLASSKNPSFAGDSVTFSVHVAPTSGTSQTPTGTVILADGTTVLASGLLDDTATFLYTTSALTMATHPITASYSGDGLYAVSAATISQVVNHAPAVASNLTWANPAGISYGTALSATQLNAVALDATGAAIPGTFAYTPAAGTVLAAGTQTLSVVFTPTDLLSFLSATKTVTIVVVKVTPVLTWATPASIAYGIPLSATQLNATATGLAGATLPGVFTYTPAAGAVLAPGTQTLSASFAPADAIDYNTVTSTVSLVVSTVTVASFTPNTATLGAPDTTITVTGAGFVANSVVQVNGVAILTTLVNPTTLTAVIPASDFLTVGTLQISVLDPTISVTTVGTAFTVTAPPPGTIFSAPPTTDPGTQPIITFNVTQTYPVDLQVTLNLGFASSTTPQITNNQQLQLACQDVASKCVLNATDTTLTFVVPANTTTVPVILLQAGTIAGTITVPITLTAGGADVTPATLQPAVIVVPPAAPTITGVVSVTRVGKQLTVVMHGFSNTREMVNAKFHFIAAPGATLDGADTDITLPADVIFNTDWFQTVDSEQYGSTFTYTQIFNTSDDASTIGSVEVTLTNTVGASPGITSQ